MRVRLSFPALSHISDDPHNPHSPQSPGQFPAGGDPAGGTILVITLVGSRQAINTFSQSLMTQTIEQVEGEITRFIGPAIRELQLARSWGREGMLDLDNTGKLNRLFMPLIRQHPQISSLMVADERGHEYMLLKGDGKWLNRITRREEWGERSRWLE